MTLQLTRFQHGDESTAGILFDDKGTILCKTIELAYKDNQRSISSVPVGNYKLAFRDEGGFYSKYMAKKWANSVGQRRGMLELQNVPGRDYILIHIGNWAGGYSKGPDTEGCILLNTNTTQLKNGNYIGGGSVAAYKRVYPIIADMVDNGDVWINISDA